MTRLGAVIAQAIVHYYGRDEFLAGLAHSSGITTSVVGAFDRFLLSQHLIWPVDRLQQRPQSLLRKYGRMR
jgi:hypothetical protein